MNSKVTAVDIVIVGGGTVGLALAIDLLQSTDFTVAIVEAHEISAAHSEHPSLDARCLALATTSHEYLNRLFKSHTQLASCPIEHIQVSDRGFIGKCYLHADEVNVPQLGVVTPIQSIGVALLERFQQLQSQFPARALWFSPNSVENINRDKSTVLATLDDGQSIEAKLLVFADGGRTPIKQSVGFESTIKDYAQTAIIANVVSELPHNNWAFERFTAEGPLALLPLDAKAFNQTESVGLYSLVWTIDGNDRERLQRLTEDDSYFLSQLSEMAGQRHGRFIESSERSHYPLSLSYCHQTATHRCIAIGNAAQALHPIAGQGFNLGLRDVQNLAKQIRVSADNNDLGDWAFTHQYQQSRKADRELIIGSTDTLVHSFSNHHWPLVLGRNAGLLLMNKLAPLKHHFARRAMGY